MVRFKASLNSEIKWEFREGGFLFESLVRIDQAAHGLSQSPTPRRQTSMLAEKAYYFGMMSAQVCNTENDLAY
jgi:hypothetical protein